MEVKIICECCAKRGLVIYLEIARIEDGIIYVYPCPECLRREATTSFDEGYWLGVEDKRFDEP